jgi:hypothetical protein
MSLGIGEIVGISIAASVLVGSGGYILAKRYLRNNTSRNTSFDSNSSRVEKNTSSSNPLLFLHPNALHSNASGKKKTKKRRLCKKQ